MTASSVEQLRKDGNELFKCGDYEGALTAYTQALGLGATAEDQAILHRNLAACHLKLEDYNKAEAEASKAIEKDGGDVKALYRRSQALEKLGRLDQAVLDLQRCVSLEPKNKVFQEALRSIGGQIEEKVRYMSSTDAKVEQMFQILLDPQEKGTEKKQKASQNLVVLAREEAGAEKIFRNNGVQLLQRLLDTGEPDLMLAALRTLVGICSEHQSRTVATLSVLGTRQLVSVLGVENQAVSLAACHLLQVMFDALKEGVKKGFRGKEGALIVDPARELKVLISNLLELLTEVGVSGQGRDNALTLLIKVVPRKSSKDPNNSLTLWVIDQGLKKILEVGGSLQEPPGELAVTANSRMSASTLLSKLFDDLKCDAERENFHRLCENYIRSWFEGHGLAGKLRAIQTVSCLLQGPCDAGNRALELSGVMESVIALCASEQEEEQRVAVEALIYAAGKAKRASFITANGVSLLKDLYKRSEKDSIRIRALVGLCKLGSAGGTDFSMKQFAEGSTLKLAKQCRKWLCNDQIDAGTRRWAVEGLAYLTFDADVKEGFVEDEAALKALFQLGRSEERAVLFAVASALVNCTNSYDYEEPDPKMVELAKYAKQHVPEQHPKDKPSFVRARVRKLLAAGVVSAMTCMVKTESPVLTNSCKELLSRVFLALVEEVEDRGTVVAQGGGKALLPLALEGTDVGQTKAAQALAKLTITSNPEMTFPGERIYEVVRPLVSLLHLNCSGLQNFEALMALTNLAGISERLRQKILKEKAMPMIEGYMFEDHEMLRRAATECMCNLAMSKEVQDLFEAEGNDRLKLLVLYSGEEDELLRRAAAGGLAMLTSVRPSLCSRIPQVVRRLQCRLAAGRGRREGMAEERHGSWFGFGFCGFGQALGSGRGRQVRPEPLRVPGAGADVCRVSASWSYTAFLSRAGQVQLSGSVCGAADACRDAWASETLLVVLRDGRGPGRGAELQAWAPGSALCGEPLWVQTVVPEAQREDGAGDDTRAGPLPLLPGARAYVSPLPPLCRPLAPELRARRLELGTEHALLLDEAGQVYSWGGGRHGQLGHGTLAAEPEPRLLEALQGLPMAEVAAGGWHSVCVSETGDIYIWGWNESGQLALPTRSLAEDRGTVTGETTGLDERGPEVAGTAGAQGGAPAPFIAVQPFPALLDLPLGSDAVKASCGSRHTAVVTRAGELYTWGWGKYGQLGHGDTTSWDRPCRVEYFIDKQLQVVAVSCGPWNTYVYAVQREELMSMDKGVK